MLINKYLDGGRVNFVVFGVCADEANKSPLALVIEFHDKPVVVPSDIENHSVISNDAG